MFPQIFNTLQQSGWKLVALEGNWVSATHESLNRGLIFGNLNELPQDFKPILQSSDLSQWDVIVFCPQGIDSSDLKNIILRVFSYGIGIFRQATSFRSHQQMIP